MSDARAVEPLIKALGERDVNVSSAAAGALKKFDDAYVAESLVRALGDPGVNVRRAAALALGELPDARAVEPLIKALGDGDESVSRNAAEALGKLGDHRAVNHLIKAIGKHYGRLRETIAVALKKLGEPKWNELIEGNVWDYCRLVSTMDSRVIEPLLEAFEYLNDKDQNIRRALVAGLVKMNDPRVFSLLINSIKDGSWCDRKTAASGLGDSGNLNSAEPLIKALGDGDKDVRWAAACALITLAKANPSVSI